MERWNAHAQIRQDLFGFVDVLALVPGTLGLTAIQATTATNVAHRVEKIQGQPRARLWLQCGNRILVLGWSKRGPQGTRKAWAPSERWYRSVEDLCKPNEERGADHA